MEKSDLQHITSSKPLNILIAEDEPDIAHLYKTVLEKRNHKTTITRNGEDCLKVYHETYQDVKFGSEEHFFSWRLAIHLSKINPFDVVILDCKMPQMNGIEVAKEILAVNPHQRIIFASAYIKDTVADHIEDLKQVVTESVHKPFEMKRLVDLVEDNLVYHELRKFNVDIDIVKAVNPTHEQIADLLGRLQSCRVHKSDELP